jgi:hypothetical protein
LSIRLSSSALLSSLDIITFIIIHLEQARKSSLEILFLKKKLFQRGIKRSKLQTIFLSYRQFLFIYFWFKFFIGVSVSSWLAGELPCVVFFRFSDLHGTSLTQGFSCGVRFTLCMLEDFPSAKDKWDPQQRTNKPKTNKT